VFTPVSCQEQPQDDICTEDLCNENDSSLCTTESCVCDLADPLDFTLNDQAYGPCCIYPPNRLYVCAGRGGAS